MRSELRKLKRYADALKETADAGICRDGEGRAVIRLGVSDRESVFSEYSTDDRLFLSEDFASHIENRANGLYKEKDLTIEVVRREGCEVSEGEIKSAVVNYYTDKLVHQSRRYGRNGMMTLVMLVVGLVFLAASLTLGGFDLIAEMFVGVLDIAAWVFIWEAVDKFFFERNLLKIEFLLYKRLADARIKAA